MKTEQQYKALTVKEFTKAAEIYESGHAGLYEICKEDYPYIAGELAREEFCDLLDCGCGTGRAVFYLAQTCRAVGVELDERRYAQAADNLARCRKRAPEVAARVELVCGSAQDFEPDGRVTAVYFFNPFPASVLRGVLRRIGERSVRLFCYYPDDEWVELLLSQGWTLSESVDLRETLGKDVRERVDIFVR